MTLQNGTIINKLIRKWPYATVAVSSWLEKEGANRQLVEYYTQSHWLERIGHGAYKKAGEPVEWSGGLYAIQHQSSLKMKIHVGAKSALELQNLGHFVPMGTRKISLIGLPKAKLPNWFLNYAWGVQLQYATLQLFNHEPDLSFMALDLGTFSIFISSRERAILEAIYFIPEKQSFEEAYYLMEGLATLRPELLQVLLESCRSIKVKRVFLFLARCCNHAWKNQLNIDKIDLGSGKRVIDKNGFLDKEYLITVPRFFENERKNLTEGIP